MAIVGGLMMNNNKNKYILQYIETIYKFHLHFQAISIRFLIKQRNQL